MIDLHCHILPGLDDGAKSWDESLQMARLAVSEGITHILATPHHMNRSWMNQKGVVESLTNELQDRLDAENIPLIVFPGQEVRLHGEIIKNMNNNEICFIDEGDQYVLIEFPTAEVPAYADRLFYEMQTNQITPIIVHPERNHTILKDPNILYEFANRGVLSQLTAASYIGKFGKEIEKLSHQMIDHNLTHFIASDAHNTTNRLFHMKEAMQKLEKEFGNERVQLFDQTTRKLINGDPIISSEARRISEKKGFFGLF